MPRISVLRFCGHARVERADGARLRAEIERLWCEGPVEIDFEGCRVASVSFFDEGIGLLALEHAPEDLASRITVQNISEPDRALLNRVVAGRARERLEALSRKP